MSASSPPPGGVIHDLGYRHYDGPRLGSRAVARALFVDSLRGAYGIGRTTRSKVMPLLLLVAASLPPVIIGIIIAYGALDEVPGGYTRYVLTIEAVIGLYVAGQAPASVSRDLRFRVVSLYFSRPLRRIEYVAAKYAALATAAFALMAVPLTLLFAGALLGKLPVEEQVPDFTRSLAGAAVTAVLVSGVALAIAAVTPRRGLGVAAIIAVLVVLSGVQGAVSVVAEENGAATTAGYAGLISPFTLAHGVQSSLFGAQNDTPAPPPGATGGAVFTVAAVVLVLAVFAALHARYRNVRI